MKVVEWIGVKRPRKADLTMMDQQGSSTSLSAAQISMLLSISQLLSRPKLTATCKRCCKRLIGNKKRSSTCSARRRQSSAHCLVRRQGTELHLLGN